MANIFKAYYLLKQNFSKFRKGDFRARYIVALGIIATLSIFQQIIVQWELNSQLTAFKTLHKSRANVSELVNLKKELYFVQTYTNVKVAREELDKIISKINNVFLYEKQIWQDGDEIPDGFTEKVSKMGDTLHSIREGIKYIIKEDPQVKSQQISEKAFDLASAIDSYLSSANIQLDYFEDNIEKRLKYFKNLETIIFVIMILVLVFEATFIFAPALKMLEKARMARESFFSKVSHEIKNPMNSILGMTDLIQREDLTRNQRIYIRRLRKSATGLLGFLNNIIHYAGIGYDNVIKYERIDLFHMLEEIGDLFFVDASKKNIRLSFYVAKNYPSTFESDKTKLRHILINLVGNAVKFTDEGNVDVLVSYSSLEQTINFEVRDTGIGISSDKQKEVFLEFTQEELETKKEYGGTGLGLAIAKEFTYKLGGEISLESQKGEGTSFFVTVPVRNVVTNNEVILDNNKFVVFFDQRNHDWIKSHALDENVLFFKDLEDFRQSEYIESGEEIFIFAKFEDIPQELFEQNSKLIITDLPNENELYSLNHIYLSPLYPWQILDTKLNERVIVKPNIKVSKSQYKVLICDDIEDNRDILQAYLEPYFSDITLSVNGYDCLEKINKNDYDFVFLDIQLPDINGNEVIVRAKKILGKSDTTFIAFTANDSYTDIRRMKRNGFKYFLKKPIESDNLVNLIKELTTVRESSITKIESLNFEEKIKQKILNEKPTFVKSKVEIVDEIDRLSKTSQTNKSDNEDREYKMKTLGHQLKGVALLYEEKELGEKGAKLEEAVNSKEFDTSELVYQEIRSRLNELRDEYNL